MDNTSFLNEVNEIISDNSNTVYYYWTAQIFANGKTIFPFKVISIDIVRDYAANYADDIILEVAIPQGSYYHDIYPYKDNLLVTLFKEPLNNVTNNTNYNSDIESQSLRATIIKAQSGLVENNNPFIQNKNSADLTGMIYIKFQLVDLSLEQIRMITVGGVYKNTVPGDLVKHIFTDCSSKLNLDDEHKIKGVEFFNYDNNTPVKQIVLTHGLKLIDLPGTVHNNYYGIYNSGLGFFLQKHYWYFYPLFNKKRFDQSNSTATFLNIPKNRLPNIENTFRKTSQQLVGLVTGNVLHRDDSEDLQLNHGNGIMMTDASKIMKDFGIINNNKLSINSQFNVQKFVSNVRTTALNNVQNAVKRISSNILVEAGRLLRRSGSHIMVHWQNSDPGSIYPGMPVKYMFLENEEVIETTGIIVSAHHSITMNQPGFSAKKHISNSALTLFVDNDIDWNNSL